VARAYLLDTGFLVALVNGADPDHEPCAEAWNALRGSVVTVEGVLVEASHLLARARGGSAAALHLVASVNATIVPLDARRMRAAAGLMDRYRNVPMDLVDALLVLAAQDLSIRDVLTLDRRGFAVYRVRARQALRMLPH
jgi:predicted nucleic acid-binding protein